MAAVLFEQSWGIWVPGTPIPQGSMTCVGGRGRRHNVQPSNKADLTRWRQRVTAGALEHIPVRDLAGPVHVEITFTIARPPSAPDTRVWPHMKATRPGLGGDIDKLARAVLDALSPRIGPRILTDDAAVVELIARKAYPDTPGVADRRDRPGALIRIKPL